MATMEKVDADYLYRCVMSVVGKLSRKMRPEDHVPVKGQYGQQIQIAATLYSGSKHLQESFNDEHWHEVQAAFSRLSGWPPSRRISDCCEALMTILKERPADEQT